MKILQLLLKYCKLIQNNSTNFYYEIVYDIDSNVNKWLIGKKQTV